MLLRLLYLEKINKFFLKGGVIVKKRIFLSLIIVSLFAMVFSCFAVAANKNFSTIRVSSNKGQLVFFDTAKGKVYVYGIGSGKLQYAWQIEDLGQDLKKEMTTSLSVWDRNLQ